MPLRPSLKKANAIPGAPAPAAADPAAADYDHHLLTFWEKYNRSITYACGVIAAAILAYGAWDYLSAQRERGIEAEFAAATTPSALREFVAAHPDSVESGVAELQLADGAYAQDRMSEAVAGYTQAESILKTGPFAARARLGLAMAEIQSGRSTEGQAELRALVDDAQGYKAIRAEAAYHLASIAAAAGQATELQNLSTRLMQIDPDGPWTERAFALQAAMPQR